MAASLTPKPQRHVRPIVAPMIGLGVMLMVGCGDDGPAGPESLRFGQVGEVRMELSTPLRLGLGELRQRLVWRSSGPWDLTESIWYRGAIGEQDVELSSQNPDVLAGSYAQFIAQMNDVPALTLFEVPDLPVECQPPQSTAIVSIRDAARGEEEQWTRCVSGTLESLTTTGAGPDGPAGRVASAMILARDYTLGESFFSVYSGSVPFATLERGDETNAELSRSRAVGTQTEWESFWAEHRDPQSSPPEVDFVEDMVLVGAVGLRLEAGDTVEIRRVLSVGDGTRVEIIERVPGDFCSPAERQHFPFHMVLIPRVPSPVLFNDLAVERVPCG